MKAMMKWPKFIAVLVALVWWTGFLRESQAQSRLEHYYNLLRPDGLGPFPALMLVPGSPGIVGNRPQQAEALKEHGYVVVFVDYLSARGVPTGSGDDVPREEIVKDIVESASYLRAQPFVNASQIGAIGWSRGGVAILMTLAAVDAGKSPPFRAVAVFYPSCRGLRAWQTRIPILLLLGALDTAARPEYCQELAKKLPADYPIRVHVYPDARHSFDRTDLPAYKRRQARGGNIGYNPDAATQAWEEVRTFFAKHLEGR